MPAETVAGLLGLFESNGLDVTIDGGWGVDALLGAQTRDHEDLDIALPHCQTVKLRESLGRIGYKEIPRDDTRECNFVLADDEGHEVDVHSYTFDENARNVFGVAYEPEHLTGKGMIQGHAVKCIAPEWLVRFHAGYEPDENDYRDVKALCERFGIALPGDFKKFET